MSFAELWELLLPLGRDPGTGGYRRYSFTAADAACREWFCEQATQRSLRLQTDRNGNLAGALGRACGVAVRLLYRHREPPGLGTGRRGRPRPARVASGFAVIDLIRERGFVPSRPIAVAAFCEEEGGRFGVACLAKPRQPGAGTAGRAGAAGRRRGEPGQGDDVCR